MPMFITLPYSGRKPEESLAFLQKASDEKKPPTEVEGFKT